MMTMRKEREEMDNPELTFQPKLLKMKDTTYMYTEREQNIAERSQMWTLKKQEKLKLVAE